MTAPRGGTDAEIAAAFRNALCSGAPTWFPGLGGILSDAAWARLAEIGIAPETYGTARVRARDVTAPRTVEREIDVPAAFLRDRPVRIERLSSGDAARYVDLGMDLAPSAVASSAGVAANVRAAFGRLATVPTVAEAIGNVLHVLHVIMPEAPDIDVSYSDPTVPFSVWVGISNEDASLADLRLAEGILHESMHLQLSLIEAHVPLVAANGEKLHSPWRNAQRPVQGVLQGTYVFATIREFMSTLHDRGLVREHEQRHVADRVAACAIEVSDAVSSLRTSGELTAAGRALVEFLATRSRH